MRTPSRRALFLHGQFLTPQLYQTALAPKLFETLEKSGWECVTIQSPRRCPDPPPDLVKELLPGLSTDDYREWINAHKNKDGVTKTYHGLQESLNFLQDYLCKEPRFDVIMGHSNGALMASILAHKLETDKSFLPAEKHFHAVALFNAPASYETEVSLTDAAKKPVQMPSLHIFGGETDLTWQGQQQMKRVHHPTGKVIQHAAGHFFPKEQSYYDDIVKSLNEMVDESL